MRRPWHAEDVTVGICASTWTDQRQRFAAADRQPVGPENSEAVGATVALVGGDVASRVVLPGNPTSYHSLIGDIFVPSCILPISNITLRPRQTHTD